MNDEDDLSVACMLQAAEARVADEELSLAVAQSLHEAEESGVAAPARDGSWSCKVCTLDNLPDVGRCRECHADREAPHSSSSHGGGGAAQRCGLPGCARTRTHFGFCSAEHKARAEARRLLPPPSDDVARVYLGATGEYAVEELTRAADREAVVERFRSAWRKGEPPRVELVFRVKPLLQLREACESYLQAVGNARTRFHGTGAACHFDIDLQSAGKCDDAACALCSIPARGFSLRCAGSWPNRGVRALSYGAGLYFSSTSGKSHDYATERERVRKGRRWRPMFVARVEAARRSKRSMRSCPISCGRRWATTRSSAR